MELKFKTLSTAKKQQKLMKEIYGYKPAIFRIESTTGSVRFSIVKPMGLIRIKKRKKK